MNISVLLAEDHAIVREGLHRLLEDEAGLTVTGEAETGREAVEMAVRLHPDVVVMDITMPLLNGLDATAQILKAVPACKILVLSAHGDGPFVGKAIEAGVSGFLFKQSSISTLARGIREIHKGASFFSPAITKRLLAEKAAGLGEPSGKRQTVLSPREVEVLQLIAESKANKEVASELGIGIKTVEKHRANLMKKLNIHDTAGLTRYAISNGMIECDVPLTFL